MTIGLIKIAYRHQLQVIRGKWINSRKEENPGTMQVNSMKTKKGYIMPGKRTILYYIISL